MTLAQRLRAHPQFLAQDARDCHRLADEAARRGDLQAAVVHYGTALTLWQHASGRLPGRWEQEQDATVRAYAASRRRLGRSPWGKGELRPGRDRRA